MAMVRSPFAGDPQQNLANRNVPILPSSTRQSDNAGEPIDLTPPASASMGPPGHINSSPEDDHGGPLSNGNYGDATHTHNGTHGNGLSAAAATSSQQPKVVQTAFIHKLYNMLEDPSIQNLISWSSNNESFVMSPTAEFSKVLSQYFKHTNISSFVRQLNMYGFHKVSDVFHTGAPEQTLWEFKHGNGNFKRGDLAGLREIKRRASRHALIHRDSLSSPQTHKPSVSQPGTPAEPVTDMAENRLLNLEHSLYEVHARLMRTEESNTALSAKCQALNDSLVRAHRWNLDMTHIVSSFIPDPDNPVRHNVATMEKDIVRHLDLIRNYEDPHESLLSGRQPYFSNITLAEPLSPRQAPLALSHEERRPSLHSIPPRPFRPTQPPPQRRYGSIGTAQVPLPNYHRPLQPHPPPVHPLSHVEEPPNGPNLGRRHTSADIRVPGWPGHGTNSPLASGQSSSHWPSSPMQAPHQSATAIVNENQHIQNQLASYEFGAPRQKSISSHQTTPPLMQSNDTSSSGLSVESNWSFGAGGFGGGGKFGRVGGVGHLGESAPGTRRSSMASNVHSLLNPAETAERDEDEGLGPGEERKRKRLL